MLHLQFGNCHLSKYLQKDLKSCISFTSFGRLFQSLAPYTVIVCKPYFVVLQFEMAKFTFLLKLYAELFIVNIFHRKGGESLFTDLYTSFKICLCRYNSKVGICAFSKSVSYELLKSIRTKRNALQ